MLHSIIHIVAYRGFLEAPFFMGVIFGVVFRFWEIGVLEGQGLWGDFEYFSKGIFKGWFFAEWIPSCIGRSGKFFSYV